jgi:hypothetical protein
MPPDTTRKRRPNPWIGPAPAVLLALLVTSSCAAVDQGWTRVFGGYTDAELEACMSGPGAGLAGLLRGQEAGEAYCRCVLDKLAEQFSWKERRDLATSSVIERGGLLALGDSTYVRWASANLSARTECSGATVGGSGEGS